MRPIDFFDEAAEAHPDRIALIDGNCELSYGELHALTCRVAEAIVTRTSQPVPRVAIISPNDYRLLAVTLATMRAGGLYVPVHAAESADKVHDLMAQVEPDLVFHHSDIAAKVACLKPSLPATQFVCLDAGAGGDPSLDDWTAGLTGTVLDWGDVYGNPDRPSYMRQTSGSTGVPKLIVADIASSNETTHVLRSQLDVAGPHPRSLAVAPLSHVTGTHALTMLGLGATVIIHREFDAAAVLHAIAAHRVTHTWLPASGLYVLLMAPELAATDCSSLRSIMLGASAVSPRRLADAVNAFGPVICQTYSQIEAGFLTWLDASTLAAAAAGDHPERLASSGRRLHVSRIAIMDDDGARVATGTTGEIVVRGRSVRPYLDAEACHEAHRFGWHHTGDLGYFDRDGFLYVVGRKKDNIITAGLKVSAAEVEQVILELTFVRECAVVPVPDDFRGEAVAAVITPRPGEPVDVDAVVAHCRSRLGARKAPRRVECWPSLPRSAAGKVDKRQIRDRLVQSAPDCSIAHH